MSELHTDDASADNGIITQEHAPADLGTVENGPELATGEGDNPDNINQDSDQDGVNKAINKAHHLKHKAERATAAETKRADDLQAQLNAIEANKPAPVVDEMPDRFDMSDEEFNAALLKRDTQRQAKADYNAAQKTRQDASQAASNQSLEDANARITEAGNSFRKKADELGISKESQNSSAKTVMDYGVSNDLLVHICGYDESPLIMQYLAANPAELSGLSRMGLAEAAIHVDGKIRKKVASVKPVNSNAPAPLNAVKGSGAAPKKRGATGTKFE